MYLTFCENKHTTDKKFLVLSEKKIMAMTTQLNLVYILEDSEAQAFLVSEILSEHQYTSKTFTSADNLIAHLDKSDSFPVVIIVDYHLPTINGIAFVKYIREKKYPISCIFFSAYDRPEIIVEAINSGADDFLVKDSHIEQKLPFVINRAKKVQIARLKQQQTEQKLQQERKLFAQGPLVIFKWAFQKGWPVTYVSENIEQLGFSKDFFDKNNFVEIIAPDDIVRVSKEVLSFIENNQNTYQQSYRIRTPQKGTITVFDQSYVVRKPNNDVDHIIGYIMDISDWQQSKQMVFKLSAAIEHSNSVVMITDTHSRIEYVNPYFTQLTGYSAEYTIGKKPSHFGHRNIEQNKELYQFLNRNQQWNGIFENKKKNGTFYWERAAISPIFDDRQNKIGYLKIGEDITQEIEAQKKLEESEKRQREANNAKNKLLSVIAHDLRGPVGSMKSLIDFIFDNPELRKKEDIFKVLQQTAADTYTLLDNLLLWAKNQKEGIDPQLQQINVSEITKSVISLIAKSAGEKNITITLHCEQEFVAFADPDMLHSVLRNIISNAIKFTPENGHINVDVQELNKHIQVSVTDTGIGISQDDIQKILDPDIYFTNSGTNNEKGSGLGLQLAFDFIKKNNGTFSIESSVGVGTSIIFNLPKS